MKFSDFISFNNDLFFGGAVQLDWLIDDTDKAAYAARNFVFHGPKYHGVGENENTTGYRLTDTVSFTHKLLEALNGQGQDNPITMAIAGYGTGKSHLGVTIASLLSSSDKDVKENILENLKSADEEIGSKVEQLRGQKSKPHFVIVLNGMKDFSLSSELSKQALAIVKRNGLPTKPLEDLWPRFQAAKQFCKCNYDLRKAQFIELLGERDLESILSSLDDHDDKVYKEINKIYHQSNGFEINAAGQESPQDLISTIIDDYCGAGGFFESFVVLFDEIGRYLQFAAENPQISGGESSIQQLFEGIQSNSSKSHLLCFNQYELRAYVSRIASDLQVKLQPYITRFESAHKYYLSSNLETLFAHLIEKKDPEKITEHIEQPIFQRIWREKFDLIRQMSSNRTLNEVWQIEEMFKRIIVQGCWPLDPSGVWLLSHLGSILQNRSSIAIIKAAINQVYNQTFGMSDLSLITAVTIAKYGLIDEFIANERFGAAGSDAELYLIIKNKIERDGLHEDTLLSILLFNKLKLVANDERKVKEILASLSGFRIEDINEAINFLHAELGVIEWNSALKKYDLIENAIPRSKFVQFLDKKVSAINQGQVEDIFIANSQNWARLNAPESSFSVEHNISTSEWKYDLRLAKSASLRAELLEAYRGWKDSFDPEHPRGTLLYCYFSSSTTVEGGNEVISTLINDLVNEPNIQLQIFPFCIVPIFDTDALLKKYLSEYFVLTTNLPQEDLSRYRHFIEDHKIFLADEIPVLFDKLKRPSSDSIHYHPTLTSKLRGINHRHLYNKLFSVIYDSIKPFPFDGFNTIRGNAAKDSREITIELIKSNTSSDWLSTKTTQLQNRFRKLLGPKDIQGNSLGCWDVIDENGRVRLYPKNESVKELILNLEKKLESQNTISISELLKSWIKPPFGLNLASAGLLLGTFVSGRSETLVFTIDDQVVSREHWISSTLDRYFIDLNKVGTSKLKLLDKNDTNEWRRLLESWDAETFYVDRINYKELADDLERRIGIPPEFIQAKRELLVELNKTSQNEISEKKQKIQRMENILAQAQDYRHVGSLIDSASKAMKVISEMSEASDRWHESDLSPFRKFLSDAKEQINQGFSEWLARLYVGNVAQLDRFEGDQRRKSNILRSLQMPDLARNLDRKIETLTVNLNRLRINAQILGNVDSFIREHYFTNSTPIHEIDAIIIKATELKDELLQMWTNENETALLERANDLEEKFINRGEEIKKRQSEKLSNYFNVEHFTSLIDMQDAISELTLLKNIYEQREDDRQDIDAMLSQLNFLKKTCDYITEKKRVMSLSSLEMNVNELKREYEHQNSEADWYFDTTVQPFFDEAKDAMTELSQSWISSKLGDIDITKLESFQDCLGVFTKIKDVPPYLTDEHNLRLSEFNYRLQARMAEFKLENIIALFKDLDSEQKERCYLKIKEIVEN